MAEEIKISPFKAFVTDPVKLISLLITSGSLLFAWGSSSANHKNDVSGIAKEQAEMKTDIKSIQSNIASQNQAWNQFLTNYAIDKKAAVELGERIIHKVTVLDTALDTHFRQTNRIEERLRFWQMDDEKKNTNSVIPQSQKNQLSASE